MLLKHMNALKILRQMIVEQSEVKSFMKQTHKGQKLKTRFEMFKHFKALSLLKETEYNKIEDFNIRSTRTWL